MLATLRPYCSAAMMVPSALFSMVATFCVFWLQRDYFGMSPGQTTGLAVFVALWSVFVGVHGGIWFKLLGLRLVQQEGRILIVSKEIGHARSVAALAACLFFMLLAFWLAWVLILHVPN
jgi:hypothetical protein